VGHRDRPSLRICSWNKRKRPSLTKASTLPKRTCRTGCARALLQPLQYQLSEALGGAHHVGRVTALSVEIRTKVSTPVSMAASAVIPRADYIVVYALDDGCVRLSTRL